MAFLAEADPQRLIFLDESGCHIGMTRTHARAPRGRRAVGIVPRNRGRVVTMLGAMSLDGMEAMMLVQGGTTAAVFKTFVREHLGPRLRPGDFVIMDNLGAHHATGIRELIESYGATPVYMPPYSPDLNPIELALVEDQGTPPRRCRPHRRPPADHGDPGVPLHHTVGRQRLVQTLRSGSGRLGPTRLPAAVRQP